MIEFVESSKCRHSSLAKFFDESLSACGSNCDFCKTPKDVESALKSLSSSSLGGKYSKRYPTKLEDDGEPLYEGGRAK